MTIPSNIVAQFQAMCAAIQMAGKSNSPVKVGLVETYIAGDDGDDAPIYTVVIAWDDHNGHHNEPIAVVMDALMLREQLEPVDALSYEEAVESVSPQLKSMLTKGVKKHGK